MLRVAVSIAAAALFALAARADDPPGSRLQAGLEEFAARLALTSAQEAPVRSIFEEHLAAQRATLERYDVDAGGRGGADAVDLEKMRALHEELRAHRTKIEDRLSRVLSDTQMTAFRRVRAERERKLLERLLSRRLDRVGAKLALTPDQTEPVRAVLKDYFAAQLAVLDRHGVAPGDLDTGKRPGFRTLRRLRRDLGENNEKALERLSAILSGAQLAAYEALQAEQRKKLRALLLDR